jgi:hypothetical protein
MSELPGGHDQDDIILEPYYYLSRIPGKDVRGLLVDAFQVIFWREKTVINRSVGLASNS